MQRTEARIISMMESFITVGLMNGGYWEMCRKIRRVAAAYGETFETLFAHYRSEAELNCA
jgi:hypothetical protein